MGNSIKRTGGFTKLDIDQITEIFEQSLSGDDGFLNRQKFETFLNCGRESSNILYKYFDIDQNGEIDSYKFICGLSNIRQSSFKEKAIMIFDIFNQDDTVKKLLDRNEIENFIQTMHALRNCLTNSNKSSKDNKMKPALPTEEEVELLVDSYLKKYDLNRDQMLSQQEFMKLFCIESSVTEFLKAVGLLTDEDQQKIKKQAAYNDMYDEDLELELQLSQIETDPAKSKKKQGNELVQESNYNQDVFGLQDSFGGDQFMAVKPWVGAVKNSVPSTYKKQPGESDAPNVQLELEYVHGYRCHDVRNNLKYGPNNQIVYHTATVGIVLNQQNNTQKFLMEHTDDIMCLDVFQNLAVTGQIGHKPLITLWDIETQETIVILKGKLEKGISNVVFSRDGKMIGANGLDDDHCLIVYNIQQLLDFKKDPSKKNVNPGLIACGKGPKSIILNLVFSLNNDTLIAACQQEMIFFGIDLAGKIFKPKKGSFGQGQPPQPVLSCVFVGNNLISGQSKGELFLWSGTSVSKVVKDAHKGAVNSLEPSPDNQKLISGGADGYVHIWSAALVKEKTFQIVNNPSINSVNFRIRSVAMNAQNCLLVGTRGSEIIEFTNPTTCKVLNRGHYDLELWGMCTHPKNNTYYTAGEDSMVAQWDIQTRKQLKNTLCVKFPCSSIDIDNSGTYLAVGCRNGNLNILSAQDLTLKKTFPNKGKEISVVKFSPDAQLLAVGITRGGVNEVRVLSMQPAQNQYKTVSVLKGNPSRVIHIDFSVDSQVLQLNNSSYEILWFDPNTGKQKTSGASENRDEPWASYTCIIGWPVQGIWPPCSDGSDVNSVDRSKKNDILSTGDDFGKVKLFKYPVAVEKANFNKYPGHSAHVTQVRFSSKSDYLISTGGGDKSTFQWKVIYPNQKVEEVYQFEEEQQVAQNEDDFENADYYDDKPKPKQLQQSQKMQQGGEDDIFGVVEGEAGDEAMAIKPFLGQIKVPSGVDVKSAAKQNQVPVENLKLQQVFGYRCFDDCRNTAKFLADGKVVFVQAAIGVVMDTKKMKQQFYNCHENDIVSMAVHPKGKIIASGQMAQVGKAKNIDLYVWDAITKETYCNLNKFHLREVCQLQFSPSGNLLLSVGKDDDNSLAIYDWNQKAMICSGKTDQAKCTCVQWSSEKNFITAGVKHIKFWTLNGTQLSGTKGSVGGQPFEPIVCATSVGNSYFTGTSKGTICSWGGGSLGAQTKNAHAGAVSVLYTNGQTLFSGGADGIVQEWQVNGGQLAKGNVLINIQKLTKFIPEIRTFDIKDKRALIGTGGSDLFVYDMATKSHQLILQGHFKGEVWGCAVNPQDPNIFASCGGDKTARLWDASNNKMLAHYAFVNDVRAIDWAQNGEFLIAGDVLDIIYLLDATTLEVRHQIKASFVQRNKTSIPWIEDLKISPDSLKIAIGAHGGNPDLQVMTVQANQLQKGSVIKAGISSALTHLDWEQDSQNFCINTQAYELLFFNIDSKKQVTASAAKDWHYHTWTCVLGWASQGVFPGIDFTDVKSVCRSNNMQVMAVGDDFGKVSLLRYPALVPKQKRKEYVAHSSFVTKVKFSCNDSLLFSTGGNDKAVMVWRTDIGGGQNLQDSMVNASQNNINPLSQEEMDDIGQLIIDNDYIKPKQFGQNSKSHTLEETNKKSNKEIQKKMNVPEEDLIFNQEDNNGGDEFMAVKPWKGAIRAPTGFKAQNDQHLPPNCKVEIDYIFGYRAKDSRNNLRYLRGGQKIVYHCAGVGVVLSLETNKQQHFTLHNDDITALALHPDQVTVATGEIGAKPVIYLWDSENMQKIVEFKNVIFKGIATLTFSSSGKRLAASAVDDDHCIAVFNTDAINKKFGLLCKFKGGKEIIRDIDFSPSDENSLTSVGVKHFMVWKMAVGQPEPSKVKGQFQQGMGQLLTCASFNGSTNDLVVAGATEANAGQLTIWNGNAVKLVVKGLMHIKCIDSLSCNGKYVLCGGRDMLITILSNAYQPLCVINCASLLLKYSVCARIRSLDLTSDGKTLLVGTYGSEIFELVTNDANITQQTQFTFKRQLMAGHFTPNQQWTNEIWGLAVFPHNKDRYATCSEDGLIKIFSASKRKQLLSQFVNLMEDNKTPTPLDKVVKTDLQNSAKCTCIDVSYDEKWIAIGYKDGTVRIFSMQQNQDQIKISQVFCKAVAKRAIQEMKFSPNKKFLAIGAHDATIYIYSLPGSEGDSSQTFNKKFIWKKHSSYITHIDWSEDSQHLHSNCGAYELLFWDMNLGNQMTSGASALKDEKWASWTCTLGWPVQGIWPAFADGTDINYVSRSNAQTSQGKFLLASGDDFGKLKIFQYPSIQPNSQSVEGKGHSSHVTNVKWSNDDSFIFSTGGEDNCVFQWRVLQENSGKFDLDDNE